MADKKISQLTALSAANLAPSTDVLAVVDTSATETKKIVAQDLINGVLNVASAVGIGTASPGEKLNVVGGNNTTSTVNFTGGSNNDNATIASDYSLVFQVDANNNVGGRVFNWRYGGNGYEGGTSLMTLNASGNLGIGTASPAAKLDVNGAGLFRGFLAAYYNENIFAIGSASLDPKIGMGSNSGYRWSTRIKDVGSGDGEYVIRYEEGSLDAVTISRSGNLGLGVTPFGWNSSYKAFDLGSGALMGRASNTDTYLLSNAYLGASTFQYKYTAAASYYSQAAGVHYWFTAPSGTAGNPITFTQAMTLDASGRLGIGTTSPTQRLHLVGSGDTMMLVNDGTYNSFFGTISGQTRVSNDNTIPIVFATNSAERARITSDGNFYVNTTGAGGKFYVVSDLTANNGLRVDVPASFTASAIALVSATAAGAGWYFLTGESSGGSARIQIRGDGNVYNANGTYGTISDARLKQDIVDAGSQWDDLKAIRFRKYRMKSDVEADPNAPALFGVVAQELEQVCPGLVDDGEIKTVKSSILLMKAAKALQEAMARIESLEADVAALKGAK